MLTNRLAGAVDAAAEATAGAHHRRTACEPCAAVGLAGVADQRLITAGGPACGVGWCWWQRARQAHCTASNTHAAAENVVRLMKADEEDVRALA